uniref:Zinc finger GRF-type domain-containing protein n=1 Tax=Triticum urartu TaxID=4572 RepID=A0A8R7Q2T8_TRIUA
SASSRLASSRRDPLPYTGTRWTTGYGPAVFCSCGAKAARLTLWTDANPGQRYLSCSRATVCRRPLWHWLDIKPSPYRFAAGARRLPSSSTSPTAVTMTTRARRSTREACEPTEFGADRRRRQCHRSGRMTPTLSSRSR